MFCTQKYIRTLKPIIMNMGLLTRFIIVKGCSGSKTSSLDEGDSSIGYLSLRDFSVGFRLYSVAFT